MRNMFYCSGYAYGEDGSADLQYILEAAREIGIGMSHHIYVVDKSTVPVGTAKKSDILFKMNY